MIVWCVVGCCHAEEFFYVEQCWLQASQFSIHLINWLSILLRYNGFAGIQKAVVDQTGSKSQTVAMAPFWCMFGFGKCFGASLQSSHWAGHLWLLYKIHFLSHVTIRSRKGLLLCTIREDDTSKRFFFKILFSVSSWGTHLLSLFNFPICFKGQVTIEWSMFSYLATSHVVVRWSASTIAVNWLLLTSDGWTLCTSSSRHSSTLQNFLNYYCTVSSLAVPGANALLILRVVSAALWSFLNLKKKKKEKKKRKKAQICFLSNIISIV